MDKENREKLKKWVMYTTKRVINMWGSYDEETATTILNEGTIQAISKQCGEEVVRWIEDESN